MAGAHRVEPGIARAHALKDAGRQRHAGQHVERQQSGTQAVVYVMGVVGDVVGYRGALRLQPGMAVELEIEQPGKVADGLRHLPFQPFARGVGQRPVVLDQSLQRLPGQVQSVKLGIAAFETGNDAKRLGVVIKAAPSGHLGVERVLAGMSERRMAEIMHERDRLGEVLVATQRPRQRPRNLRDLDRVGQPGTKMVAFMGDEHLRLVFQAAERGGMDDPVAVALERRARRALDLRLEAAARSGRIAGIGSARAVAEADVGEMPLLVHARPPPVDLLPARSYL